MNPLTKEIIIFLILVAIGIGIAKYLSYKISKVWHWFDNFKYEDYKKTKKKLKIPEDWK